MAQTKFKLNSDEEAGITHAHTQHTKVQKPDIPNVEVPTNPISLMIFNLMSSVNLLIHMIKLFEILTPTQKTQLVENAKKENKTASCIIKEVLEKQHIIEQN